MCINQYRFKTKEEFIKEYGENWRGDVPMHFPSVMDFLLGIEVDIDKIHELLDENRYLVEKRYILNFDFSSYTVSSAMIKRIKLKPNYFKRTLIYD